MAALYLESVMDAAILFYGMGRKGRHFDFAGRKSLGVLGINISNMTYNYIV
jgi:hypothetical protein